MDLTIETIQKFIGTESFGYYILFGILVILIFVLVHIYSLREEKKKLVKEVAKHVNMFEKAFESATDGMLILSDSYEVIHANKAMATLLGLKEDYLFKKFRNMPQVKVGKEWNKLDQFLNEIKERMNDKVLTFPQTVLKVRQDETYVNLYVDSFIEKEKKHFIVTIEDLSELRKFAESEFFHKITHLPNQVKALHDLPALFSKIHIEDRKVALALLSFDNFSRLRSIIGYEQSNEIMVKFSKTLQTMTSEMDIAVYHTFDNDFLLMMSNVDSLEDVREFMVALQHRVARFYKIEEANLHLTVSVGIALYPDSGPTRSLLDNAYKALSSAQEEGDSNVVVYQPNEIESKYDELKLHNDMESALENGEFEVYYQPIYSVKSQDIVSAEALIRWIHPELGFVPPDVFIELMEKTGFIIKLGKYVLQEVLKQQKRWELFKFKPIEVSINVSMVEIATGEFVEHVDEQLRHHQVNPGKIKFEITEGAAMGSESQTSKYFYQLKKLGVGISLDDFGTGYTSFGYLKKFPADVLKIDKSLADNVLRNEEDQRIVHAMIELGHNLGMKIVVEGIEDKLMFELLAEFGCDYMQGYYFSKPLPVFEFQKLLR